MVGVDGMWAAWDDWSTCSKTCEGGKKERSRTCTDPKPKPPGKYCDGTEMETVDCPKQTCPTSGKQISGSEKMYLYCHSLLQYTKNRTGVFII